MLRFLLILIVVFSSCIQKSNKINTDYTATYKVISIADGDTYTILVDNTPVTIRMFGIDAPEKGMPFYRVSKNKLSELCFGQFLKIEKIDTDKYGRTVAIAYLNDGRDINLEMIKSGLAWHYKKYSSDKLYSDAEITARQNQIGLWSDESPMEPWEFRKLHKQGISTKDSFDNNLN